MGTAYLAGGFDALHEAQHYNAPRDEQAQREVQFDWAQIFDSTRQGQHFASEIKNKISQNAVEKILFPI